ncbi:tetratricopeptide [Xylariomycetidae sp. FL2044]|nr:tetratricopeptide [Xylariomycetidae sp. FL2044]
MSFFGGGPECSTAGNPLSQLAKHTQDDNSLQRDRLRNGAPQGGVGGFRTTGQHGPQDEMMNGFLQQNGRLPDMPLEGMNQIRLDSPAHGVHIRANSTSPTWANEFQQSPQAAMEAAFKVPQGTRFSPDDYARFQQMNSQGASARSSPMPSSMPYQRPMMGMGVANNTMGMGYGMGGMYNSPMFRPAQQPMERMDQEKGKGKLVELDDQQWEEQFKQLELQAKEAQEGDEAAALEPELNKLDEQILESETNEFGDFESIWRGIQAEREAAKEALDEDEWVDQFADPNWAERFGEWDGMGANSRLIGDPQVEDYLFEEENLFKDTANPFEEGMRILDEGGNLSLAALAFEAAVQKEPSHVDAWVQLGIAQAQNEKETAAIRALEQAKNLDPNNSMALMTLAVSYTNEGYDSTAYRTLERWLSIRYPSIISPADLSPATELGFTDRQQLHDRVTQLFIDAARLSPDGEHMDPDVQVGLGVLFYGAEDYTKAVDCFSSALASSELGSSNEQNQVHLLWNRLGATLANSGKSEDAIAAYEKALTLRPNFVRARYNLGVSCINMGCHAEAAGHLLAALAMHKLVEKEGRERARELLGGGRDLSEAQLETLTTQNRSTNLYDTLRRVFTQMGRRDLSERVVPGVDPEVFRGEVEF